MVSSHYVRIEEPPIPLLTPEWDLDVLSTARYVSRMSSRRNSAYYITKDQKYPKIIGRAKTLYPLMYIFWMKSVVSQA